jgi:DNA-directed RNA polymerase specialized sigma24 family protein
VSDRRPARPRLLPASVIDNAAVAPSTGSVAALVGELEAALATLPPQERAAAMIAFGLDEGPIGVAMELELSEADADALVRSALQLLRGRMADAPSDDGELYARLRPRARHGSRPGEHLEG